LGNCQVATILFFSAAVDGKPERYVEAPVACARSEATRATPRALPWRCMLSARNPPRSGFGSAARIFGSAAPNAVSQPWSDARRTRELLVLHNPPRNKVFSRLLKSRPSAKARNGCQVLMREEIQRWGPREFRVSNFLWTSSTVTLGHFCGKSSSRLLVTFGAYFLH
jgi:hypothetical protein